MAWICGATAQEGAPKNAPDSNAAPKRTRAVSAHVAAALAEKMPKYEPHAGEEKPKPDAPVQPDAQRPANGIVRLPKYIVEGERLPSTEELRSPKGLEHYTMNKYMGDADGISRGVLNHFTLGGAWNRFVKGRVPLLGRFDWKFSQEDEALKRYYDDEVRKKLRGLVDFDGASARASAAEKKARGQSGDSVAGEKASGTP
jgi:hypothetical protein